MVEIGKYLHVLMDKRINFAAHLERGKS